MKKRLLPIILAVILGCVPHVAANEARTQQQPEPTQQAPATRLEQALGFLDQNNVRFLQLEFTDLHGTPKSYTITRMMAKSAFAEGVKFDGSSIAGYTSISDSDMLLVPEITTLRILPWTSEQHKTAMVICDVHNPDGSPCMSCPRLVLKKALSAASARGFDLTISPEIEFFLLKSGVAVEQSLDTLGYCALGSLDATDRLKKSILNALEVMGCQPEKFHHEVAPAQHEITMKHCSALRMADNMIIAKSVISTCAMMSGYTATFVPKPFSGVNGSGLHINYSLVNVKDGTNAFYNAEDKNYLSPVAKSFIAGNLHHARALAGITNPTNNSYLRLDPGYEAPVSVCWGNSNRSAMIRIPDIHQAQWYAARAEMRCPDASCNPYLAFAALLATGLDGIDNNITLMPETEKNVYAMSKAEFASANIAQLPASLDESLDELEKNTVLKQLFGDQLFATYVTKLRAQATGQSSGH